MYFVNGTVYFKINDVGIGKVLSGVPFVKGMSMGEARVYIRFEKAGTKCETIDFFKSDILPTMKEFEFEVECGKIHDLVIRSINERAKFGVMKELITRFGT